ncbi:MAG: AraC family transcriptional regulator [Clostridia bacterium]|nr:AraC family transcriptional regulator [Clostridia bacterium]
MKTRNAIYDEAEDPAILDFGIEENSALAHWGRGTRDKTLIHYVLRGYGYFNGRKVSAGEGFFICRNSMHEYHSSKKDPWVYFWVSLTGERADGLCKKYISVDEYGIFTYNFCEKLLRFSKNFFENHSVLGNAETHGIFYLLMSYHEKKPEISGNRHVIEAKKYIDSNFHRPLTISEIAGSLFISDRYLYNLFVENEGISPKKYLNNLRLTKACSMLRESNDSIGEVAASVGFRDVLTFSRFFAKNIGTSPTSYRKANTKK